MRSLTELFLGVVLSVLAQTDLRCPPAEFLYAGDAPPDAAGLAKMRVSPTLARELYRRREQKWWWSPLPSRLRSFLEEKRIVDEVELPEDPVHTGSLHLLSDGEDLAGRKPSWGRRNWIVDLASSGKWNAVFSILFRAAEHINPLEGRSYKMFLRYAARVHPDHRVGILLESKVLLGGVGRGPACF